MYGCERLILEGCALQVAEDKALKKISGPNTGEINERPTDGLFREVNFMAYYTGRLILLE